MTDLELANTTYIPDLIDSWLQSIEVVNVPSVLEDLHLNSNDSDYLNFIYFSLTILKEGYIDDLRNSRFKNLLRKE